MTVRAWLPGLAKLPVIVVEPPEGAKGTAPVKVVGLAATVTLWEYL